MALDPYATESDAISLPASQRLAGKAVVLLGKLASMNKRQFSQLVRKYGGHALDAWDSSAQIAVMGEGALPIDGDATELLSAPLRESVERGELELIGETQLWERLGLVEGDQFVRRLYTPAMLAELLHVPVSVVRRWHRKRLIAPAREVHKLPYFDFQEVAAARQLAELLAMGLTPQAIEKKLAAVSRFVPRANRSLAQLQVILEGRDLLLRQGNGLLDAAGQFRFDFNDDSQTTPEAAPVFSSSAVDDSSGHFAPVEPVEELLLAAAALEDEGDVSSATEIYRTALAQFGPNAGINFLLAEALYQLGEPLAARERYYSAIEIDENYVEARANLGCVLWELRQRDLAIAAFEGALAHHPDYADVHYHLANALDELGRDAEAKHHWRKFLNLAPDSPWAEQARIRLCL